MISSTPSSDRPDRPDSTPALAAKARERSPGQGSDQLSLDKINRLREALANSPAVRPEMVERGRRLAADPAWPPHAVLRRVSEIILKAPDLTEDLS